MEVYRVLAVDKIAEEQKEERQQSSAAGALV